MSAYLQYALSPTQKIEQGKAKPELPTSSYGVQIPYVIGSMKLGGNCIYAQKVEEVKKKQKSGKGKKSSTTTYTYFGDAAYLICHGKANVVRIWENGKLVYNVLEGVQQNVYDASIKWRNKNAHIYDGSAEQMPDSVLQSDINNTDVPGYRNFCYIVLDNLDLTEQGGRYPQIEAEVCTKGTWSNGKFKAEPVSLSEVVEKLFGLASIPVSKLSLDAIAGYRLWGAYVAQSGSLRELINSIAKLFSVDFIEEDGIIIARRKDKPVVAAALDLAQMPAWSGDESKPDEFSYKRADDIDLPSSLEITYLDRKRDYQQNTFIANSATLQNNNATTLNMTGLVVETPVVEKAAIALLREAISGRERIEVTLPPAYLFLQPGDILQIRTRETGEDYRQFVIDKITIEVGLVVRLECQAYLASIYNGATTTNLV